MWILLLDRSGSMGEPFSGASEFAGRSRQTDAASKLEAAKQALREHLAGLGTVAGIVLIAFDTKAEVIYDGPSNDVAAIGQALDDVQARGGTDLAAALVLAEVAVREASSERIYRVLVVTDGKSELEPAQAAATTLAELGAIIDVTLIDATPEGELVARAVALNGGVSAVTSPEALSAEVGKAKAAQEEQQAAVETLARRFDDDRLALAAEKPQEERLSFTAAYPSDIGSDQWYALSVFLHLTALQHEVESRIREQAKAGMAAPFVSVGKADRGVARGTWLTITPTVDGLQFNPPSATLAWYEDVQESLFRFRADRQMVGKSAFGRLEITVGSLPIAHLGIAINVRADPSAIATASSEPRHANIYQDVFASYSSDDTAVVQACRAVYWGLGIHLAVDKQTLRAGQKWDPALRAVIDRCDLFQLFWSNNARESIPVREEYRYALAQLPKKGEGFFRPVVWEQPPPPLPAELKEYHFAPLDLTALSRLTGQPLTAAGMRPATAAVERVAARRSTIPAAALPLLAGAAPATVQAVREDVSDAVRFLEAITGLRYYPVPTLLVDEHVVKQVRSATTVDVAPFDPNWLPLASALSELLGALALAFHVGRFAGSDGSWERARQHHGAGRIVSVEQFDWIRAGCEVFPNLSDILEPAWRKAMQRLAEMAGMALDLSLTDFVILLLGRGIDEIQKISTPLHVEEAPYVGGSVRVPSDLRDVFVGAGGTIESGKQLDLMGPPAAFIAVLAELQRQMAAALPAVQAIDPMHATTLPTEAAAAQTLCDFAGFLLRRLFPRKHPLQEVTNEFELGRWISQIVAPRWQSIAAGLVDFHLVTRGPLLTVRDVLQAFTDAVQRLLDEGLAAGDFEMQCGYSVSTKAWQRIAADFTGLAGAESKDWLGRPQVMLSGAASSFVEAFRAASRRLVQLLSQPVRQRSARERTFVEVSPTFGIFAPARSERTDRALHLWAAEQGIAQALTLAGVDRVLFCLGARERFERELRVSTTDGSEVARLAAQFQRCVLVHEHFHALMEVGISADDDGVAPARGADALAKGSALNEALAAWMELHLVRGDAAMEQLVWSYIDNGEYPQWPYAGARQVEALYAAAGLKGVRELILRLHTTAELAQSDFDREWQSGRGTAVAPQSTAPHAALSADA